MMDFSEGTYDISISCGGGPLCAGGCGCNAEFPAVTFERYGDGGYSFFEHTSGESDRPCAGVNANFSIYGSMENVNGVPVIRSVSYSDVPCQGGGSDYSSSVTREVAFFNVAGVRREDGSVVFHNDSLGADLIVKPSAEPARSYNSHDDIVSGSREETYRDFGAEDVSTALSTDGDEISTVESDSLQDVVVETAGYWYSEDLRGEDEMSWWDASENYGEESYDRVEDEHQSHDETTVHVTVQESETVPPTDSDVAYPEVLVSSYESEPEQLGSDSGETEMTEAGTHSDRAHSDYHAEAEGEVQVPYLEESLSPVTPEESEHHLAGSTYSEESLTLTGIEEANGQHAHEAGVTRDIEETSPAHTDVYYTVATETVTLTTEGVSESHEGEMETQEMVENEEPGGQLQEQVTEVSEEVPMPGAHVPLTEAEPTVVTQEHEKETSAPEEHTVYVPSEPVLAEPAVTVAPAAAEEEAAEAEAEEGDEGSDWWGNWWW
ncbi:MAG: hypothetical protein ACTJLK_01015 [Anaplasma sp.]